MDGSEGDPGDAGMRGPGDGNDANDTTWWWAPLLGAATLFLFGGLGLWLMIGVQGRSLQQVLVLNMPLLVQTIVGVGIGSIMAIIAWLYLNTEGMDAVRTTYVDRIGPHVQRVRDRWFLSICAGVGEELFFRGALQFWSGIVLTAVLFVAIHGYLDPRRARTMRYGVLLTVFMIGFGLMAAHWGLVAPILAHIVFDVILLQRMAKDHSDRRASLHGP